MREPDGVRRYLSGGQRVRVDGSDLDWEHVHNVVFLWAIFGFGPAVKRYNNVAFSVLVVESHEFFHDLVVLGGFVGGTGEGERTRLCGGKTRYSFLSSGTHGGSVQIGQFVRESFDTIRENGARQVNDVVAGRSE